MTEREDAQRALITEAASKNGLTIQSWDEENENGLTAKFGTYVVTTDDYDDDGLYLDDEGELSASVVGAPEYGNVRVSFGFMPEGTDSPNEVRSLEALEPVDA